MYDRADLARRIKRERKRLGINQRDLADLARLGRGTILNIERGHVVPRLDAVCMIADALGVTVGELLGESLGVDKQNIV